MKTVNTNRLNQFWNEGVLPKIKALLDDLTESINGVDGKIDVLDTKEEIEANTDEEKIAGALAVKGMFGEINSKLDGIKSGLTVAGDVTFSNTYFSDNTPVKIYRNDYFAYLSFDKSNLSIDFSVGWNPDIGITIPIGFRPKKDIFLPVVLAGSDTGHAPGIANISSSGKITLYGHAGTIIRIIFKGRWSI